MSFAQSDLIGFPFRLGSTLIVKANQVGTCCCHSKGLTNRSSFPHPTASEPVAIHSPSAKTQSLTAQRHLSARPTALGLGGSHGRRQQNRPSVVERVDYMHTFSSIPQVASQSLRAAHRARRKQGQRSPPRSRYLDQTSSMTTPAAIVSPLRLINTRPISLLSAAVSRGIVAGLDELGDDRSVISTRAVVPFCSTLTVSTNLR